jgi:hypothetical protein
MTVTADRIKQLLGNGIAPEVVATAVGVTPAYVSQLMADDTFREEVVALRSTALAASTDRDTSWNMLEDKLLAQLHEKVEQNMIYKVPDIVRVLVAANNAKRRGNPISDSIKPTQQVVVLNLPSVVLKQYKENANREIVEVTNDDGSQQTLVTMPATQLMHQLTAMNGGTNREYEKVLRYLPGSDKEEESTRGDTRD